MIENVEEHIADMISSYIRTYHREPKYILVTNDLLPPLMNFSPDIFSARALKNGPEYKFMGVEIATFINGENRLEIV